MTLYIYIVYIKVTSLFFNKQLLVVNIEFFLSLSCLHIGHLFQQTTPIIRLCHPPSVDLSNTMRVQKELTNQLAGNAWDSLNSNNLPLYSIKYSCIIQMIFKEIYLTHNETINNATTPIQSTPGSKWWWSTPHFTGLQNWSVTIKI